MSSRRDLEDYEYRYYREMKNGSLRVRVLASTYRCPFCYREKKRDYRFRDLLEHAYVIGRSSRTRDVKEKAKHLALERYMKRHLRSSEESSRTSKSNTADSLRSGKEETLPGQTSDPSRGGNEEAKSSHKTKPPYGATEGAGPSQGVDATDRAKAATNPARHDTEMAADQDQEFVFPWTGIVANIKTEIKDGQHVGDSGTKLKEELASKGFNPQRVQPLWNRQGHSGFAIVEFDKEWEGFKNAIMFEKSFEVGCCGKRDFYAACDRGDKLYGWLARDDDFHSKTIFGVYLRKHCDLKSVSAKEAEDQRKASQLVKTMANTLEIKNTCLREMEHKIDETSRSLSRVMAEKDELIRAYNEEMSMMQQSARDYLMSVNLEHEKAAQRLQAHKRELEEREKQLRKRRVQNETERKKLEREMRKNERATLEQKKADEEVMRLAEQQKTEKEALHRKLLELQQKLDNEQALELEMERMKGELQVLKHMGEAEDTEIKKKMDAIREELEEKEEEWEQQELINQALIVKQRNSNDELQDARKALINAFCRLTVRAFIGVKRMGVLDSKPFHSAAKRKHKAEEAEEKALMLCSQWEDYLRDPSWHPFKIIQIDGKHEEVLDEEDEKLKELRSECGEEVFNAVANALKEMNEYNPSGRYAVLELWNFKEKRKASVKEGVSYLMKMWKQKKPAKRR